MVLIMQVPLLRHILHSVCRSWCESCDEDHDLWIKPEYRPEEKLEYYSYIFCFVDDILCIHHDPDIVLNS